MMWELAWKLRCVVINLANWSVKSTFESFKLTSLNFPEAQSAWYIRGQGEARSIDRPRSGKIREQVVPPPSSRQWDSFKFFSKI